MRQAVRQAGLGLTGRTNRVRRPEAVWRFRRSRFVRAALRTVAMVCLGILGIVALITAFLVWVSGHPLAWSVIGFLFAAVPLAVLLLALGVGLRAAVAAGPDWIGVRILRHWRVLDLAEVRSVHLGAEHPLGGFGPFRGGHFGPFGPFGPFGDPGAGGPGGAWGRQLRLPTSGSQGVEPVGGAHRSGRALILEDTSGGRIELDPDALDSGLADVVRRGLNPNAEITPDAARALGEAGHTESEPGPAHES